MRIRPTELGVKGLLLLAALEAAFLATAYSNLFFLLIAFCCVLGVVGLAGAIANLRRLDVRLGPIPLAAAGAERPVAVEIAGERRRFDLAFVLLGDGDPIHLGALPTVDGATKATLTIAGRPRSVFRARRLAIATRHPFGLFQVTTTRSLEVDVVTHPDPRAAEVANDDGRGEAEVALAGAPSPAVSGLRPFRTGDSLTSMHWKATARRGEPIVKEREHEIGDRVDLVVDRRCDDAALESALATATALVLTARAGGPPLRMCSQEFALDIGPNGDAATAALRWLAGAAVLPRDGAPVANAPRHAIHLPWGAGEAPR